MISNDKCHICEHYMHGLERCKFCVFQYDDNLAWTNDDWDILNLNDEEEWSFLQIQYRLKAYDIDCLQVINWVDDNVIVLIGVKAYAKRVAKALNVHQEVVYEDNDIGIMVINLFQEKYIRGLV